MFNRMVETSKGKGHPFFPYWEFRFPLHFSLRSLSTVLHYFAEFDLQSSFLFGCFLDIVNSQMIMEGFGLAHQFMKAQGQPKVKPYLIFLGIRINSQLDSLLSSLHFH